MSICLSKNVHSINKFNELKELEESFSSSKFCSFISEYFWEDVLNSYAINEFNSFFENDFSVYLLKLVDFERYAFSLILDDSLENIESYYIIQTDNNNGFINGFFTTLKEANNIFDELQKQYKLEENNILEEIRINSFIPHGSYTVSNTIVYLIEISDCGDSARIKDENFVSEWFTIEYLWTDCSCLSLDNCDCNSIPVIDREGYNIPLNQVMRIN
jgi:hypothetical protein